MLPMVLTDVTCVMATFPKCLRRFSGISNIGDAVAEEIVVAVVVAAEASAVDAERM